VTRQGIRHDNAAQERQDLNSNDASVTEESEIDQVLADSFPASDVPPWTLGVASVARTTAESDTDSERSSAADSEANRRHS
jgi:hypothetical protein